MSRIGMLVALPICSVEQQAAANDGNNTEDGRDGDGAGFFLLRLNWPHLEELLFVGIADALVDYGENSENEEDEACDFHSGDTLS